MTLLNFNWLIAVFENKPKRLTFKAAAKFKGPELLPTKKSESFITLMISISFKSEQSIK